MMKKLFCILLLLFALTLPALAEDTFPDFDMLTDGALFSREQLIQDTHISTGYTGPKDALANAVHAYLVQLSAFGMKQQFSLPMQHADCAITLYAFTLADSSIPTMTWADASLGWVISETHLLLDHRVYPDGTATVEILCRPELITGSPAGTASNDEDNRCADCSGTGTDTRNCTDCSGQGRTSRRCSSCGGDGQRNCSSCGGDGHRKCSSCSGSGHHSSGSHHGKHHSSKSCSSCGGDGQRRCSSCSGSGHRSCTSCAGNGKTTARCSSCSGTGRLQTSCGTCSGSGCLN